MNLKGTYMGELGAGEEREGGNNVKQFYKEIFPLACEWHLLHLYACFAKLVTVQVHRQCGWVVLFNSFPPLAVCIVFSGIMDVRKGFQVRSEISSVQYLQQSRFTLNS